MKPKKVKKEIKLIVIKTNKGKIGKTDSKIIKKEANNGA